MPQMTITEEQAWSNWIHERDAQAADVLLHIYKPLVLYHVKRLAVGLPRSINEGDLISHGMLGLYDALGKFDTTRELKFDTYASFRIRGAILDGLRREDWLPRSLREKSKKIEGTIERLEQELSRTVTPEEVAQELNIPANQVTQVIAESYFANMLSIDEKTSDSDRDETFSSTIEDKRAKRPEDVIMQESVEKELSDRIKLLNEKEQMVISLFYFEELTLTEIGQVLGLSTSRISQIHSKALFRLQQVLKKTYNNE